MEKINLSKQQKILLVLFELSCGEKKNLKFEDIVVALFHRFPEDFHLKGYAKYPDSGHSTRRPLYTLKENGILTVGSMIFTLTDKGIDNATRISKHIGHKEIRTDENFDRYIDKEIKRIKNLNSFELFLKNNFNEILDTDFFDYLGVSVRTERMNFKARLNLINETMDKLKKQSEKQFKFLLNFHKFMLRKFRKEINYKLNN